MDWRTEAIMAAFLDGLIGWEREQHGREAGIRTHAAVCLGACVFAPVSSHVPGLGDKTRIAAQVVSGVGFLGAGVILGDQGRVIGKTTAGTPWATAAVGLVIAFNMFAMGILTALIIFGLLALHHCPGWARLKAKTPHAAKEDE